MVFLNFINGIKNFKSNLSLPLLFSLSPSLSPPFSLSPLLSLPPSQIPFTKLSSSVSKFFSFPFKKIKPIEHFLDRHQEIYEFLDSQLNFTTDRKPTPFAVQMFGSGKTQFGACLQNKLQAIFSQDGSDDSVISKIKELYKSNKETIDKFLKATYVYIDLRQIQSMDFSEINLARYIFFCIATTLSLDPEREVQYFPENAWHAHLVLKYFKKKNQECNFFLHFDEIDALETQKHNLTQLYHFWDLVFPLDFIYLSGKSPSLYFIGKGLYRDKNIFSPTNARLITLKSFSHNIIRELLEKEVPVKFPEGKINDIIQQIFDQTGGVPRLVSIAIAYINLCKKVDFNSPDFFLFATKQLSSPDLNPIISIRSAFPEPENFKLAIHAFYWLFILSIFKVSFTGEKISPIFFGFPRAYEKLYGSILDMISLMSLNTTKLENGLILIIFPGLVVRNLQNEWIQLAEDITQNLPNFPVVFNRYNINEIDWPKSFENYIGIAFHARISPLCLKSQTFGNAFPWLKEVSWLNNIEIKEFLIENIRSFPKITTIKGYDPSKLSEDKKQNLIETLTKNGISSEKIQDFDAKDWPLICQHICPNVLYIPKAKSASFDLIYLGPNKVLFGFQAKLGIQVLNESMISQEINKFPIDTLEKAGEKKFDKLIYIVIAFHINLTIEKVKIKSLEDIDSNFSNGYLRFFGNDEGARGLRNMQSKTVSNIFKPGENITIIILGKKLLKQFLGEENFETFNRKTNLNQATVPNLRNDSHLISDLEVKKKTQTHLNLLINPY